MMNISYITQNQYKNSKEIPLNNLFITFLSTA